LRTITCRKVVDHIRRQNRQSPAKATGGSDAYEHILAIPEGDGSSVPEASDEEGAIIVRKTLDLIRPEFEERTWQSNTAYRLTSSSRASATRTRSISIVPAGSASSASSASSGSA
jgi:DNA-directed RNA polymerase specialized sigma24 family protein